jgi:hypothetical protein
MVLLRCVAWYENDGLRVSPGGWIYFPPRAVWAKVCCMRNEAARARAKVALR